MLRLNRTSMSLHGNSSLASEHSSPEYRTSTPVVGTSWPGDWPVDEASREADGLSKSLLAQYNVKSVCQVLKTLIGLLESDSHSDSFNSADAERMCSEVFAVVEKGDDFSVLQNDVDEVKEEVTSLIKELWSAISGWIGNRERELNESREENLRDEARRERLEHSRESEMREKLRRQRLEREEDKQQRSVFEDRLSTSENRIRELEEENAKLEGNNLQKERGLEEWHDMVNPLKHELSESKSAITSLTAKLEESHALLVDTTDKLKEEGEVKVFDLTTHLRKKEEECSVMYQNLKQAHEKIAVLTALAHRGRVAEEHLITAKDRIDALDAEKANEHLKTMKEKASLQEKIDRLKINVEQLEKSLDEGADVQQQLEEMVKELQEELEEQKELLHGTESRLNVQEAANIQLHRVSDKINRKYEELVAGEFISWEWEDDENRWQIYDDRTAYHLEKKYSGGPNGKVYFSIAPFDYFADLQVMSQTNLESKKKRNIRRAVLPMSILAPQCWNRGDDPRDKLEPLDRRSEEFCEVRVRFEESMLRTEATVERIERVQNYTLWQNYEKAKLRMARRNGFIAEKTLFHGSRENDPENIILGTTGFDVALARNGVWGRGCYFAQRAQYSSHYAHNCENKKQILFVKVLTGIPQSNAKKDNSRVVPDIRNSGGGKGETRLYYDSINAETEIGMIHVIFENDHSYPNYLITYKQN